MTRSSRAQRWAPILGETHIADAAAMETFGTQLAGLLAAGDVVILSGDLGAGKTTLTRGIGQALGLRDSITSPTFVVARTHQTQRDGGTPLIHVDAYRLGGSPEFDDLDLDVDGSIVIVEWGDGMAESLSDEYLHVQIARPRGSGDGEAEEDLAADTPRTVVITAHDGR